MISESIATGLVILALSFPVSAGAVGKTTVDPNAGRVNTPKAASSNDVTQKVTYEARHKSVLSVLTDLSKMTGVKLYAGLSSEDWQVRDRRMNIFAKDIPLTNLMNSIARVMKFEWSKSTADDGTVSYRLYMDREILLGAERQNYAKEEKIRKRRGEACSEFLTALEAAATMSGSELQSLKTENPEVYARTRQGWADLFTKLFAEVPNARQAWLDGQELPIDIASLSLAVRQAMARMHGATSGSIDSGTFTINNTENANNYLGLMANVTFNFGGPTYETDFSDPSSDATKLRAKISIARGYYGEEDKAEQSEIDRLQKELIAVVKKGNPLDLTEPLTEHPDDPALSAKVKMVVPGNEFADVLSTLAQSSSFAIVSDSFRRQVQELTFPQEEIEVRAVLDKVESVCCYNWERHSTALEFHDRRWFKKRSAQIPDAWLEAWHKALEDNGSLGLDELSQIAALTVDQYWINVVPDEILSKIGLDQVIFRNQDLLGLYCRLSKRQRSLVFANDGLDLDSVANLGTLPSAYRKLAQGGGRLTGKREMHGKQAQYTFSLVKSSGDATGKQWTVLCPLNTPPAKEASKDSAAEQSKK